MSASSPSTLNASRLGMMLIVPLGALFFLFMGMAAFAPGALATPIAQGGSVTVWFLFAFGLIWISVLATGLYVLLVNAAEDRS